MGFKIIAGDYKDWTDFTTGGKLELLQPKPKLFGKNETVKLSEEIASVEIVTEENKTSFVGKAGLGLVGAVALGPLGAIAGILAGGNSKEVCFMCTLKDGKKFMAIADNKTYQKFITFTM